MTQPERPMRIGEVRSPSGEIALYGSRPTIEIPVTNAGSRVVRVSSHFPFHEVNPRLHFDRGAAVGYHLDVPAGHHVRWAPGETRHVTLVATRDAGYGSSEPS